MTGIRAPELLPLPGWIAGPRSTDSAQACTFAAGAAAFALDGVLRQKPDWLGCWRSRLTLQATVTAARLIRLDADECSLRDALHLTRAGDDPGPAGRLHLLLRDWAARPLHRAAEAEHAVSLASGEARGAPDLRALMQADRALATRLGWERVLPLHLLVGPPRAGLRHTDNDIMAMLLAGGRIAHAEAVTLARRSEVLHRAAGSLRTRDEGRGLALILADDSVAPWRMTGRDGFGSDRAARRFCESLHRLGALRLLTERPTFRLYGL